MYPFVRCLRFPENVEIVESIALPIGCSMFCGLFHDFTYDFTSKHTPHNYARVEADGRSNAR